MTETVAAFERHLLDHLDDRAAWSAYADYLTERGEPRGDFMRVQLALEDESLPKAERRALHQEEEALRVKHLDEWVGEKIAATDFSAQGQPYSNRTQFRFIRGWLFQVTKLDWSGRAEYDDKDLESWRWLHALHINYCETPLSHLLLVRNLRYFQVGHDEMDGCFYFNDLDATINASKHLERLYLAYSDVDTRSLFGLALPRLQKLQVHCQKHYATETLAGNATILGLRTLAFHAHGHVRRHQGVTNEEPYLTAADVWAIAYSPHLKRLEHLQLNCCSAGDEGIDLLVNSGLIHRLKSLDLRFGCVTDAGASTLFGALVGTPYALEVLKLGGNALSGDGVAALRRLKLTLDAPAQFDPGDDRYLTMGDDGYGIGE